MVARAGGHQQMGCGGTPGATLGRVGPTLVPHTKGNKVVLGLVGEHKLIMGCWRWLCKLAMLGWDAHGRAEEGRGGPQELRMGRAGGDVRAGGVSAELGVPVWLELRLCARVCQCTCVCVCVCACVHMPLCVVPVLAAGWSCRRRAPQTRRAGEVCGT